MRDYKVIRWANDFDLMAAGIERRTENKKLLEQRVRLFNLGKEYRNLATRPKNKIVGLLRRFTSWDTK